MSRRTKLIIAALFLVLLAIPVVYVVLTWTTPSPLRFHIVAYHEPSSPEAWPDDGKLDLTMENTSNLPLHFFIPAFGPRNSSAPTVELRGIIAPDMHAFLVIPPHSTTAFACRVKFHGDNPPTTWENTEVVYSWYSETRYRYRELYDWLRAHTPKRFQGIFDDHCPQLEVGATVLAARRP